MDREKILDRLRKLKALADRGEGGERDNAERMLEQLAAEHGIDINNIDEERLIRFYITINDKWKRLLASQLCACCRQRLRQEGVLLDDTRMTLWSTYTKGKYVIVNCTQAEGLEFSAHLEILSKAFKRQLDDFYEAFLLANNLLIDPDGTEAKLSAEELRRLERIALMSSGITKTHLMPMLDMGARE